MATISPTEDVAIKYESPYQTGPPQNAENSVMTSVESPLKRRQSESHEDLRESDEKRRRLSDDLNWDKLIEDAQDAAMRGIDTAVPQNTNGFPGQGPYQQPILSDGGQLQAENSFASYSQAHDASNAENEVAISSGFSTDPHLMTRILSLPMLESLTTQLLSNFSQLPYNETISVITNPESNRGQAYLTVKNLFDQTKKMYSQTADFLSADELNIREPEHRATIRLTNLATFVHSTFSGQDVGFYALNDAFLETFIDPGAEVGKEPGVLYQNLKTQMYLSAVSQEEQERTKDDILDELFLANFDEVLQARHPTIQLSETEREVLREMSARCEFLRNESTDVESISNLSNLFTWEDFLKSMSDHLKAKCEPLLAPYMAKHSLPIPAISTHSQSQNVTGSVRAKSDDLDIELDLEAALEAAVQAAGDPYNNSNQSYGMQPQQSQPQQHATNSGMQQDSAGQVPYPTQSLPTHVLYLKARAAAAQKTSSTHRRPGIASQRRPWNQEEENALMAGLDQVKGPHWSQILALYGPNGSVNELLKDRNQVQLKDKARNLKLFFLKSAIEVPYYLQSVTGELKTRAPSQAARREAEDRAKQTEDQAHFSALGVLSNGLQNPPQPYTTPYSQPPPQMNGASRGYPASPYGQSTPPVAVTPNNELKKSLSPSHDGLPAVRNGSHDPSGTNTPQSQPQGQGTPPTDLQPPSTLTGDDAELWMKLAAAGYHASDNAAPAEATTT